MNKSNNKEVLKSSVNKVFKNILKSIEKNFSVISGWIFYIITFITLLRINDYNRINMMIAYFVVITLLALMNIVKNEIYKKNEEFPAVNKRFTKKLNDEKIVINKKDWQDAILYLYDIENYLGK